MLSAGVNSNRMCKQCYCFIYDMIISPLPLNHYLRPHIKMPIIVKNAHHIAESLQKLIGLLWDNTEVEYHFNHFYKMFEYTLKDIKESKEPTLDHFVWNKLNATFKKGISEIEYAICISTEEMNFKDDISKVNVRQFFMNKLRILINHLKDIHREHTEKKKYVNPIATRSLTPYELMVIRQKAGLPFTPCEVVPDIMEDLYDIYD